ncbi:MAG: sugar phosphate isomerase/epimerase family protein [Leadbetterella sp.]
MKINRSTFLKSSAGAMVFGSIHKTLLEYQNDTKSRYTIGACDWSIDNMSNIGSMEMAKRIGLDGVQLSLGLKSNDMHLRQKDVQEAYKSLSKIFKVGFSGLGIGELNFYPYKSDPMTDNWVADSIDVAKSLGVKVVLLAFFEKGDLKNDPKGTDAVIQKLKDIVPKAEKKGIILGIESWLSAQEHMYIIDKVGSPNVQVYYDVANSEKMGYNIYEEILWLGKKKQICEFHFKENGALLGKGRVDFSKVLTCLQDINYSGAIQIEGAVPKGELMFDSYLKNNQFVRDLLA